MSAPIAAPGRLSWTAHNTQLHSVHLPDELVDVLLPVTEVTTLHVVLEFPGPPATSRVGELERPQEVRGLLEVRAGGEDLVHEVLHGEDVVLAERCLNDTVVREGNTLLVDLAVTTLVDELTNGLQVGLAKGGNETIVTPIAFLHAPVCNVRLDETEHLLSRLRDFDEDTVVDLKQTEELQNFSGLWCNLVYTVCLLEPQTKIIDERAHPRIRITK